MKIVTIKERIKKSEEKIIKLNKTLERHQSQLTKKIKALASKGIDIENYDKFDENIINYDTYWELCDYEHKIEDIENTNEKIREAIIKLEELEEKLENQLAKEKEVENLIPEALDIFLKNWKQKCIIYYKKLSERYISLKSKSYEEYKITKEELQKLEKRKYSSEEHQYISIPQYTDEEIENILNDNVEEYKKKEIKKHIKHRYIEKFKNSNFIRDVDIMLKIVMSNEINYDKLDEILDNDVKIKKEMFINRIYQVIGEIKDLSNLTIGDNGEINGIAKGVKCNAKVETIGAGGYNIKCFHFRVLVNTIK